VSENRIRAHAGRRTDWGTPWPVFTHITEHYGPFALDAAALPGNAKVTPYYTPDDDGLRQPWVNRTWCNPPYGRELPRWLEKAIHEAQRDVLSVLLLPSNTDTAWFHDLVLPYADITFVRGRINFVGSPSGNTKGSIIAVYRPERVQEVAV
jgi:site-specific DNA-methyltransferase (adenine-specific)